MVPYERFTAWQLAHALALEVYRLTRAFPIEERYGLTSQARRAAFSIAATIAEGSAKRGPAEFRRFLDMSLGSLSELAYVLRLAKDLGLMTNGEWEQVDLLRDRAGKATWVLYRSVAQAAAPTAVPPYRSTAPRRD